MVAEIKLRNGLPHIDIILISNQHLFPLVVVFLSNSPFRAKLCKLDLVSFSSAFAYINSSRLPQFCFYELNNGHLLNSNVL